MQTPSTAVQRSRFLAAMVQANGGAWPDLEDLVTAVYARHVKRGDLVFDVGVNRGLHLFRLAKRVGPTGKVVGVEAAPAFVDHVRKQLETRRLLRKRIELHACAVAAQAGTASFFVTSITDGGLSGLRLRPVIAGDAFEQIEVETRTLDTLLPRGRVVRFVKIDIEGGEYDAFRGAHDLLAQKPLIAFEFDRSAPGQFGFDAQDFIQLLWNGGYDICDIFGFRVESGPDMMDAGVWNFLAVPGGLDAVCVTAPARRTLEARFPGLRALSPRACVS